MSASNSRTTSISAFRLKSHRRCSARGTRVKQKLPACIRMCMYTYTHAYAHTRTHVYHTCVYTYTYMCTNLSSSWAGGWPQQQQQQQQHNAQGTARIRRQSSPATTQCPLREQPRRALVATYTKKRTRFAASEVARLCIALGKHIVRRNADATLLHA